MEDLNYSNKRKGLYCLVLVLCGFLICWTYRDGRLNEAIYVQIEKSKPSTALETTKTVVELERYYAPTEYIYDDTLLAGETFVKESGELGEKTVTVMCIYTDGRITEEKVIDTEIISQAIPRVVCVGTQKEEQLICPLGEGYVVSSNYGWRWGRNHDGIDLAVSVGEPVYASASGQVTMAQWYYGYGKCVDIDHGNGIVTRYAHLDSINVKEGESVSQGAVLGTSGNTGNSTGPHLHFEIRENNIAVNPRDYIDM